MPPEGLTFFQSIIVTLIGVMATGLLGVAIASWKIGKTRHDKMINQININTRCIVLIKKALILKAQMTDEQIKHDHPSEFHEYERILKEILADDEIDKL